VSCSSPFVPTDIANDAYTTTTIPHHHYTTPHPGPTITTTTTPRPPNHHHHHTGRCHVTLMPWPQHGDGDHHHTTLTMMQAPRCNKVPHCQGRHGNQTTNDVVVRCLFTQVSNFFVPHHHISYKIQVPRRCGRRGNILPPITSRLRSQWHVVNSDVATE